jgi:type IV secretion system protein VirB1
MLLDLPALVQQCAPQVGPVTMHAIIRTESGGNPWIIGDNTTAGSIRPATKAEAVDVAKDLIGKGHNLDIGLGQVNSRNLAGLGLSVDQVFDPCTNLAASAAILTDNYRRAVKTHGKGQQALLAALSAYNTGSLVRGFGNGYVQKVVNNSGVQMSFNIPSLAAGTVYTGKHGSVRVGAGGSLSPYSAPLQANYGQPAAGGQPRTAVRLDPRHAPLEAPGFGTLATANE